ncbi:conserved hypothetical protein [Ricinus communis]|uniref:Uncharacterized protein n=1 Tax=Ricinus communis TaxID=3988 RepID=B9SQM8_RICCO|nr:conserved hypothetical protein [Ricinus communis]
MPPGFASLMVSDLLLPDRKGYHVAFGSSSPSLFSSSAPSMWWSKIWKLHVPP